MAATNPDPTAAQPLPRKAGARRAGKSASVKVRFDAILNSIDDHAILTLDLKGKITSCNLGAEKVKGFNRDEIIGEHFSRFYTVEDNEKKIPQRVLAAAAEAGRHQAQGWRLRKNGEKYWANVVVYPVHGKQAEITGFVKIIRDITLEHQLESLKEDYNQSQRQEMIGQLTGGVAHDFNNFLTVIEAGQDLVGKYTRDSRIERILEVNKVAIDKSRKLISQLLAFSRKQVLKPISTDVNETISVFDVLIEKAVGDNLSVHWNLGQEIPRAYIDSAQLQSALLNLVVNARDATAPGGTIKIFTDTEVLEAANYLPPYEVPAGKYVVLGVSDTGAGMSEAVAGRAIEPFYTTKDVGKGTGLGLSQCYGFARQSGGTLIIDSAQGFGTTVRILLPALASNAKPANSPNHRTILLVDDEFAIRSLVGEMLRGLGHTVVEAEDARDALDQLHKNVSIDYLFTDIIMPNGINGLQLVEEARSIKPGLPALLASGYPRDVLRNIADLKDDVMFMQKPYTMDKLAAHISTAAPVTLAPGRSAN